MRFLVFFILPLITFSLKAEEQEVKPQHYLSHHDVLPLYGPDAYINYVNPEAPKGGKITLAALGSFDTLNPFVIKGTHPAVLMFLGTFLFYESLMSENHDEKLVSYCHIAESVEHPKDNLSVTFTIRKEARFSDNSPITADDVVFSFDILKQKGKPFYRAYYADVTDVQKLGDKKVRFLFKNSKNKELAMLIGQMPILSKNFWSKIKFEDTILTPPISSGPYVISKVEAGRSITFKRNPNYWGKDLPMMKGRWNFDKIKYDYYRDSTLTLQAFIAGEVDFRVEVKPSDWFNAYNGPSFKSGFHVKEEMPHETPPGRQGLYFNIRRPIFADPRIREALTYLYDFEWINKNFFYGKFIRVRSYFERTDLESEGLPEGEELRILKEFEKDLPERVFKEVYNPPKTDGTGNIRDAMRKALRLFKEAGWVSDGDKLVNAKTKVPFKFEILISDPYLERIIIPFVGNLSKVGIQANVRLVDTSQYQVRMDSFDFDMVYGDAGITFSPGNEQEEYWGSKNADRKGSHNITGLKSPLVDKLIQKIINAETRGELVSASKAFDRVLQWQFLSIPLYYNNNYWVAYKNRFGQPRTKPKIGLSFHDSWWIDPEKDKLLMVKKPVVKDS